MQQPLNIVKIGGNVVDDPSALQAFLTDFAHMEGRKILVHGGGKEATRLSKSMGIETTMINGRRVTDRATLDVVTMVYAGLINKRIVSTLQSLGCDAIGLTGADGNAIEATRRNPIPTDYGYVGDITPAGINTRLITMLTNNGLTPIFCAINHDKHGQLLNCNADSVAAALAKGLAQAYNVDLTYCFELPGVLADINDPNSVVSRITAADREQLIATGVVGGGMIPKIDNALDAVAAGVSHVVIKQAACLLDASAGTTITANGR